MRTPYLTDFDAFMTWDPFADRNPANLPDAVFEPYRCGGQPDGDGECMNEVPKGCLCEACKEYNKNHA
jgi:hypothetical protein